MAMASSVSLLALSPPVAVALTCGASLGFAGCVAFAVTALAAPDDRTLSEYSDVARYVGPGLYLAPAGALLGGETGMKFATDLGNVVGSGISFGLDAEKYGFQYFLSTDLSKLTLLNDIRSFAESSVLLDEQINSSNLQRSLFLETQAPDQQAVPPVKIDPPGLGDVIVPGDPPDQTP